MIEEWRLSLFRARKQLVAFLIVAGVLVILAGVVTAGSLLWASLNSTTTANPAGQQFSKAAKLQAVADGLNCAKLGAACPDFDHTAAYLTLLIQDSAQFSSPSQTVTLIKNADGWKTWAIAATKDAAGSPTNITETGTNVTFNWGSQKYTATFVTTGTDSRLTKLTKGNDVP